MTFANNFDYFHECVKMMLFKIIISISSLSVIIFWSSFLHHKFFLPLIREFIFLPSFSGIELYRTEEFIVGFVLSPVG